MAKSSNGETAMHMAALHADPETARLLIEKGAPVDTANRDGESPAYWAALSGSIAVLKALVEKGASLSRTDLKGNTLLHAAADDGHEEVIAFLLEKKLNRLARNKAGLRPVDLAKMRGQEASVKLLSRP